MMCEPTINDHRIPPDVRRRPPGDPSVNRNLQNPAEFSRNSALLLNASLWRSCPPHLRSLHYISTRLLPLEFTLYRPTGCHRPLQGSDPNRHTSPNRPRLRAPRRRLHPRRTRSPPGEISGISYVCLSHVTPLEDGTAWGNRKWLDTDMAVRRSESSISEPAHPVAVSCKRQLTL